MSDGQSREELGILVQKMKGIFSKELKVTVEEREAKLEDHLKLMKLLIAEELRDVGGDEVLGKVWMGIACVLGKAVAIEKKEIQQRSIEVLFVLIQ